jgi:uncharacterized protein
MKKLSQVKKIAVLLKEHPQKRFSARQLAEALVARWPDEYETKRSNPRFASEEDLLTQITAEVGAHKNGVAKQDPKITWRDKPRPRVYWYEPEGLDSLETAEEEDAIPLADAASEDHASQKQHPPASLSEHDLYPLLAEYLSSEHGLHPMRIDEKKSANRKGSGGNQWLHPDLVALETLDKKWNEVVRTSVRKGNQRSIRLWSFEVKKDLALGDVRKCFFQAVSNSTWANFGYLVTTGIKSPSVEPELRMLSGLHGIGVLLLNTENPSESELLIPAHERTEVDWLSVNRIVEENTDFHYFVEQVSVYLQTGRIIKGAWKRKH